MSRPRKTQQRSIDSTSQILGAARERFAAEGFELVSIDAIAADCGRTKGAVYHHFESKEALFERVFGIEQRRIADAVVSHATAVDPVAALQEGIGRYLLVVADDPGAARITLLDAPVVLGWQRWRSCDGGPFRAILNGAVQSIESAGRLRTGLHVNVLSELLLGAITEAALTIATSATTETESFNNTTSRLIEHITTQ